MSHGSGVCVCGGATMSHGVVCVWGGSWEWGAGVHLGVHLGVCLPAP